MSTILLRLAIAIILLAHSLPTIIDGTISIFGNEYLNNTGFAPFGPAIAWAIKLSHVAAAICLIINRYIWPAALITIFILVMGIIMVHFKEGWFVVGGGRNGVEFNFLMIAVLVYLMMHYRNIKRKKY